MLKKKNINNIKLSYSNIKKSNNKINIMNTRTTNSSLSKKMDIVYFNKKHIIFRTKLSDAKTIFVKIDHINSFMNSIFDSIKNKCNIIIADGDITFPKNIDVRYNNEISKPNLNKLINSPFVNKIFVENLSSYLPKTYPIPLGINKHECSSTFDYFLKFENINENKPLKITNFNRERSGNGVWKERGDVAKLCKTNWSNFFIDVSNTNHTEYLQIMGSYLFTICVHGGGLDVNPKLWEALLIGVIPIIRENKPYTDIYERFDFPVVIVKKWDIDTINENNLILWYNKYYNYFKNNKKREKMLNNLSLDFWVNYIKDFENYNEE